MISKLTGQIDFITEEGIVLDVTGVGYQVFCSRQTLMQLPNKGSVVSLWIETHIREDHIHLYGFIDMLEQEWFRILMTVQGVGAKVALAIQGILPVPQLILAITSQDKNALTQISGIGPKLALRILTELKDKASHYAKMNIQIKDNPIILLADQSPLIQQDAISALINLGYKKQEASIAVNEAARILGSSVSLDNLIRIGLQELSK
ncbi:MAG: Holliday junction branch migration protein RuvA [Alphaproteobacteria bacterium]|nr:Holliday junction branch migration protein RuvA [Alphaproteobacteria bacterium]